MHYISCEDYPSSFNVEQKNPAPDKAAVKAILPYAHAVKCEHGWVIFSKSIWSSDEAKGKLIAQSSKSPEDAWRKAAVLLGAIRVKDLFMDIDGTRAHL
jgi:hypothetical protein